MEAVGFIVLFALGITFLIFGLGYLFGENNDDEL